MAKGKKDSKKNGGKRDKATAGAVEAVEAVRGAVERTFSASAEGAKSTGGRAKEVTVAANRIREVLEDRVVQELKGLRADVEGLAKRVQALEVGPLGGAATPAGTSRTTARKPAARRAPAAKRTTGSRATAAKPAAKPAASSRSTAAKPAAARSTRKTTSSGSGTRKPATRRASSTRSRPSGGGSSAASGS
jgi:hypothetical protein